MPASFERLLPFVGECIAKINADKAVRIVNGEGKNRDDTPDFEQSAVWGILVGGTKLSRGYTVEGLTVSYYRRVAGAGDTLMQMGRWFGFRKGYGDLVRLFIGRKEEKGHGVVDLYETFGAVCRDEEALRADLRKYSGGAITPRQVPPLVRQHAVGLPPTAKNKMFNAVIEAQDLAGEWEEKTVVPKEARLMADNLASLSKLFGQVEFGSLRSLSCVGPKEEAFAFEAYAGGAQGHVVAAFLDQFRWGALEDPLRLLRRYVSSELSRGRLREWLVLLPQTTKGPTFDLKVPGLASLATIERSRVATGRFNVFSEPRHRAVAAAVAGVKEVQNPSSGLRDLCKTPRAVLVVYLVRGKGEVDRAVNVGFGIQFPGAKKVGSAITWTVRDKANERAVVVDVD
jgi:hypothetical protein